MFIGHQSDTNDITEFLYKVLRETESIKPRINV